MAAIKVQVIRRITLISRINVAQDRNPKTVNSPMITTDLSIEFSLLIINNVNCVYLSLTSSDESVLKPTGLHETVCQ